MLAGAFRLAAGYLLPVLVLLATAWVLGRAATRAWGPPFAGRLEKGGVSLAAGLALLAHLLLLLGLAGALRPVPLLAVALAVQLILGPRVWRETREDLRGFRPAWIAALALAVAPAVVLGLDPPTAFDETLYHLPFARAFAASGGVPFLPDLRIPVFPQADEVLFAALLAFGPDVSIHALQLASTLLTALLLAAWARRYAPVGSGAGGLAAAIFAGSPLVVYLAATGYIEAGLTLFVTGGLYAVDRSREQGDRRWLGIAALLLATAADVKYLGLFFLGAGGLVMLVEGRDRLRGAVVFGAAALVTLAPWYLRLVIHTGNPLFPYAPKLFGTTAWTPPPEPPVALLTRVAHAVRMPWDAVFARDTFGRMPPLSPAYLAALPLLAWGFVRERRLRPWLAVAMAYICACAWLPRDPRYLICALPLVSLGAAVPLSRLLAGRPRTLAWGLAAALFLPGWLYGAHRGWRLGPVPVTPAGREAFLARNAPGYPAVSWLNRARGGRYTVWAFHAENLKGYAAGRFLGDWVGPAKFDRVMAASPTPEAFHTTLRRLGVDHLLVPRAVEGELPFAVDSEAFRRRFAPVYADPYGRVYALR